MRYTIWATIARSCIIAANQVQRTNLPPFCILPLLSSPAGPHPRHRAPGRLLSLDSPHPQLRASHRYPDPSLLFATCSLTPNLCPVILAPPPLQAGHACQRQGPPQPLAARLWWHRRRRQHGIGAGLRRRPPGGACGGMSPFANRLFQETDTRLPLTCLHPQVVMCRLAANAYAHVTPCKSTLSKN